VLAKRNIRVTDESHKMADEVDSQVATDPHGTVGGDTAQAEEESNAGTEATGDESAAVEMAEQAAANADVVAAQEEVAAEDEAEDELEAEAAEEEAEQEADEEESDTLSAAEVEALLKKAQADEEIHMDWYILKVQSNRERSIAEALERKIAIAGLSRYFGQVIVPTEKVTEFKGGKKKIVERKLYPGYIVVQMHINDDTWFAVRETSGVGDFTGAGGKPSPMLPNEVSRIVQTDVEETDEAPKLDIRFASGEKVKVKEGNFENFEGEVSAIDEASGRVTVMINIFGRSTPVELEYWQIEAM
jgi:transcription termination/antitermination protein NusG